jgi:hypothetical protein
MPDMCGLMAEQADIKRPRGGVVVSDQVPAQASPSGIWQSPQGS